MKHVLDFIISHEHINKTHFSHLKDVDLTNYKGSSDYFIFYEGLHNTPIKSVFACLKSMMNCNLKPILRKISIPVLIIEGSRDILTPIIDSVEMYNEMKNAELDVVKGKHDLNVEKPKIVDEDIFNFLKKHNLKAND